VTLGTALIYQSFSILSRLLPKANPPPVVGATQKSSISTSIFQKDQTIDDFFTLKLRYFQPAKQLVLRAL